MRAAQAPRYAGRITTWKDEQGFGFITPNCGGPAVFVHISAFTGAQKRPLGDEIVSYELTTNDKGQPRAGNVAFFRAGAPRRQAPLRSAARPLVALGFLGFLGLLVLLDRLPAMAAGAYPGMSLLTFAVYAHDKSAARNDRWRTAESTLHLLGLFCGWPGALLAQHFLRHKSAKPSFQHSLWCTVIVNCGVLGWLLHMSAMR